VHSSTYACRRRPVIIATAPSRPSSRILERRYRTGGRTNLSSSRSTKYHATLEARRNPPFTNAQLTTR
jgi:hypothetical protein